jgi:hypothetical protein
VALKNLRKILWTIAYPKILTKDVAKRVQERKKALMKKLIATGEPIEKVMILNRVGLI